MQSRHKVMFTAVLISVLYSKCLLTPEIWKHKTWFLLPISIMLRWEAKIMFASHLNYVSLLSDPRTNHPDPSPVTLAPPTRWPACELRKEHKAAIWFTENALRKLRKHINSSIPSTWSPGAWWLHIAVHSLFSKPWEEETPLRVPLRRLFPQAPGCICHIHSTQTG